MVGKLRLGATQLGPRANLMVGVTRLDPSATMLGVRVRTHRSSKTVAETGNQTDAETLRDEAGRADAEIELWVEDVEGETDCEVGQVT